MMKYALTLIAAFICTISISLSDTGVLSKYYTQSDTAGLQPLGIYINNWDANIFCAGRDNNYNGIFEPDSGDVLPSWWIAKNYVLTLSGGSSSGQEFFGFEKLRDLNFGSVPFPFRPAVSHDSIFLYINGMIRCLKSADGKMLIDSLSSLYPDAMAVCGNILAIAQKTYKGKDTVFLLDIKSKKFLDTVITGENVGMLLFEAVDGLPLPKLYILNEGTFGMVNSRIQGYDLNQKQSWSLTTGGLANHISMAEIQGKHYLIITMNGSHEITVIDPLNHQIISTVKTPTSGYNGPRESYQMGKESPYIISACYNSKLYASDFLKGKLIDSLALPAKPEGLAVDMGTSILIACPFVKNGYELTNIITKILIVSDAKDYSSASDDVVICPNPAGSAQIVKISAKSGIKAITVMNISGQNLYHSSSAAGESIQSFDTSVLNTGVYFIQIEMPEGLINKMLTIIK